MAAKLLTEAVRSKEGEGEGRGEGRGQGRGEGKMREFHHWHMRHPSHRNPNRRDNEISFIKINKRLKVRRDIKSA